jgi:hypothetical protein
LVKQPEKYLKYEYFLPGENTGVYRVAFPYSLTLLKGLLRNRRIQAKITAVPVYAEFYNPKHPSQALYITFGIMNKFWREALARHEKPKILIIPGGNDFAFFRKHKRWPYENIVTILKEHKIDFIDAGPEMLAYAGDRDPCELFYNCDHHCNIEGYKVLSDVVYKHIKQDMANTASPG